MSGIVVAFMKGQIHSLFKECPKLFVGMLGMSTGWRLVERHSVKNPYPKYKLDKKIRHHCCAARLVVGADLGTRK